MATPSSEIHPREGALGAEKGPVGASTSLLEDEEVEEERPGPASSALVTSASSSRSTALSPRLACETARARAAQSLASAEKRGTREDWEEEDGEEEEGLSSTTATSTR